MTIIEKRGWTLIHKASLRPIKVGEPLPDFRGDVEHITDGDPPHKPSSTGRVYTMGNNSYFPGVFNLKWVQNHAD